MIETIALLLFGASWIFFTIWEYKSTSNRTSKETWLTECRDCLKRIESMFQMQCSEFTNEFIVAYSRRLYNCSHRDESVRDHYINSIIDLVSEYTNKLQNLKNEYLNQVFDKTVIIMGTHRINSLPEKLIVEYKNNINEIHSIFLDIQSSINTQLLNLRSNINYGN